MSPDDEPYLSNHHTNRLIWGAIVPSSMDNRTTNAMLILVVLLSAGCLETVDEIIEDIGQTIDAFEGDYPQLEMPERARSSPGLHSYDACDTLLEIGRAHV